jgi:hypothetical protein
VFGVGQGRQGLQRFPLQAGEVLLQLCETDGDRPCIAQDGEGTEGNQAHVHVPGLRQTQQGWDGAFLPDGSCHFSSTRLDPGVLLMIERVHQEV